MDDEKGKRAAESEQKASAEKTIIQWDQKGIDSCCNTVFISKYYFPEAVTLYQVSSLDS